MNYLGSWRAERRGRRDRDVQATDAAEWPPDTMPAQALLAEVIYLREGRRPGISENP
jgi:hypothetical protein